MTLLKILFAVKNEILDIKVAPNFSQKIKISLMESHFIHCTHKLLYVHLLRKILKAKKLLKTYEKVGGLFTLVNLSLKKVDNCKGYNGQT
jgi:hypothetical protein